MTEIRKGGLAAALFCALAPAAAAQSISFERGTDLKALVAELNAESRAAVVPAPAAVRAAPAPGMDEPLDPFFLQLGDDVKRLSKAEWKRRLDLAGGRAALAPLSRIDPSRKLVVFIPGIGFNLQDAYALAQLDDAYQVVIGVYNKKYTLDDHGRQLALALESLMRYRLALAAAGGAAADGELRLIGHSYGGLIGQLVLSELVKKGLVHTGEGALFRHIQYVCLDAGWRGFDAPWVFTLPVIKHIAGEVLPRIPLPIKASHSHLTVINRTDSMNEVLNVRLPENIKVHMVNVPVEGKRRMVEPVDGWYSYELGKGEMRRIWDFLRAPSADGNRLDAWKWGFLIRKQGLQQLWRTLEKDSDYGAHEQELYEAAVQSRSVEEFQVRYDEVIARIVDTFHGQHTQFMWTDPAFMPWIRQTLGEDGGA